MPLVTFFSRTLGPSVAWAVSEEVCASLGDGDCSRGRPSFRSVPPKVTVVVVASL